jgi:type II secretory pathway component GspD/PulD (secretin)
VVGRNISFPTSSTMSTLGAPVVSYTREDVAITLKVTPQINESNFVTLEVYQEVSEVEESAQDSSSGMVDKPPTTSKRSAETTVVVRDNQTVVLGGLISSTETEVETKVPILGDLPLLGVLFRSHKNQARKTNMMIFLTPHVIDKPEDLEEVYRVKWAQRQEYIRRFYGKGRDKAEAELADLLQYSMNQVDRPSPWRTKILTAEESAGFTTIGGQGSDDKKPVQFHEVGQPVAPEVPAAPTTAPDVVDPLPEGD